jgi:SAM-dependent methyltransferase
MSAPATVEKAVDTSRLKFGYFSQEHRQLLTMAGPVSGRVLDVGCGTGANLAQFRRAGAAECYGVEISEDAGRAASENPSVTQVTIGNIEDLSPTALPAECEIVIVSHVLEHLRDPWAMLVRLVERLRPGGRLLGGVPNAQWLGLSGRLLLGRWEYKPQGVMDWTHLRWFTRRSLTAALRAAGLSDLQVSLSIFPRRQRWANKLTLGLCRAWLADTLWFKGVKPPGWHPPQGPAVYPFPTQL